MGSGSPLPRRGESPGFGPARPVHPPGAPRRAWPVPCAGCGSQAASAVLRKKVSPFVCVARACAAPRRLAKEGAMSAESLLLVDDDRLVHEALERELAGRVERVLHAFE